MVRVISTALLRGVEYGGDNRADGWAYELDLPPEDEDQEPVLACYGTSRAIHRNGRPSPFCKRRVRGRTVKPSPPTKPAERVTVGKQVAQTKFAWE